MNNDSESLKSLLEKRENLLKTNDNIGEEMDIEFLEHYLNNEVCPEHLKDVRNTPLGKLFHDSDLFETPLMRAVRMTGSGLRNCI